ncbi:MAG: hypothetical protein ACI9FU_001181 [Granulosicoccus sp.]|jgi:uncharacterized protein
MEDSELKVRLSGLSTGEHSFKYKLGQAFFSSFESELLEKGEVDVDLILLKKETHYELTFDFSGWIASSCDRCLVDYHHPISSTNKLFAKLGEDYQELSDEMVVIPRSEHELDAGQWVFEFILMAVPMKKVGCEVLNDDSICDEKVLERTEEENAEKENPIWDALKGINKN